MILDFPNGIPSRDLFDAEGRCLYEVLDAATGEVIPDPIFFADDERGFYRRWSRHPDGSFVQAPGGSVLWEEVVRPIRIVPRLERLCATLRPLLASLGVSADDIPKPVLGALALFYERLEWLVEALQPQRESIRDHLPRRLMAVDHPEAAAPPINSAEWLELVAREGRPWTRADLERFLPEVRLESVTRPLTPEERVAQANFSERLRDGRVGL